MSDKHLDEILSNWSNGKTFPKAVYTIPNGSNPTGASMNSERKKTIYEVKKSRSYSFNKLFYWLRLLKKMISSLLKMIHIIFYNLKY